MYKKKQYSDAEKAAYYKKLASQGRNVQFKKTYKPKAQEQKPYRKSYIPKQIVQEKGPGMISSGGGAIGGAIGSAFGPLGTAVGSFLGGKLGHLVEKITGFGDYTIENNTIMKGGMTPPQVVNSIDRGGTIIRHREYITDIAATIDFTILKFPLNPGQSTTFPWLAQIAKNYDQYRFRGILFEFVSTSSDAVLSSSTSTALGTVSLATDYDVLDEPYASKREMLNAEFSNGSKPSCTFIHPIECKRAFSPMNLQYVRTGDTFPANSDARMYDLGNTFIATEGMQAASGDVGELWVTYEVEFFKQQLTEISNNDPLTDNFKLEGCTSSTWLGTNDNAEGGSTLGGTKDAGSYYFPTGLDEGYFLITYSLQGTAATLGQITPSFTNCAAVDVWYAGVTNFVQSPASGVSSVAIMCQLVVKLSAINAAVSFGTAVIPTGTTTGNLIVTQFAPLTPV